MLRRNFEDYIAQPDSAQTVWRYMDFPKFVSILDMGALFFPQVKRFADPQEGYTYVPTKDMQEMFAELRKNPMGMHSHSVVSCWCLNDHESDTLWGKYASPEQGIAICTTVAQLNASLDLSQIDSVHRGTVIYRDPPEPDYQPGESADFDVTLFYKRPPFKAESEYRITGHAKAMLMADELGGTFVKVNLETLLETVILGPRAEMWFWTLVSSLVRKVAPSATVTRSTLLDALY